MNHIIIFLSELLSIRKDYFIINKKISIYEIIIEEIDKEIFRIDLNNFLKFLYYFILSFPTHYLNKLSKICDWIIKVFIQTPERNSYKKVVHTGKRYAIMIELV